MVYFTTGVLTTGDNRKTKFNYIITYHCLGYFKVGGSALGILKRTLIGLISWYGGCISASSINVIPADQTSHWNKKKRMKPKIFDEKEVLNMLYYLVIIRIIFAGFSYSHFRCHPTQNKYKMIAFLYCLWQLKIDWQEKRHHYDIFAYQYGVPIKLSRRCKVFLFFAETPKSAI